MWALSDISQLKCTPPKFISHLFGFCESLGRTSPLSEWARADEWRKDGEGQGQSMTEPDRAWEKREVSCCIVPDIPTAASSNHGVWAESSSTVVVYGIGCPGTYRSPPALWMTTGQWSPRDLWSMFVTLYKILNGICTCKWPRNGSIVRDINEIHTQFQSLCFLSFPQESLYPVVLSPV